MKQKLRTVNLIHFSVVIIFAIFLLYPTLDLALTGDDYLGLWRLENIISNGGSYITHFFSDYGPQDILTKLLSTTFGLNPFYYFLTALILRILASLSLYPLVLKLTNNKKAALVSSIFFISSTVGMELLDWSFNMPSYIGISFMNLSIYYLINSLEEKYFINFSISLSLFSLAIFSQPLRLLIIITVILGSLAYLYISRKESRKKVSASVIIFIILFLFIISFTNYGGASGVTGNKNQGNIIANIFTNISSKLSQDGVIILLSPVAQFGNIIFPTNALPQEIKSLSPIHLLLISILVFISYIKSVQFLMNTENRNRRLILTMSILGTLWGIIVVSIILPITGIHISIINFFGYLIGGYGLLMIMYLLINDSSNNLQFKLGLIISLLIITTPIIPFWVRNPGEIQNTFSRYLIVSSAGMSILLGVLYSKYKRNLVIKLIIILFIIFNIISLRKYIINLQAARNNSLADSIRSELMYKEEWAKKTPTMIFYLEYDNEQIFYHNVYFGFPFFIYYYHGDLENPWNIAYSTRWEDITAAYKSGQSLEKFGVEEKKPLKLKNIYSYKLEGTILKNTTENTRSRLTESLP